MSPQKDDEKPLHIVMFTWFAIGHFNSYLHLANKLAKRGHKISLIVPTNTQSKLSPLNHHPSHITFYPVSIPPVDGLPAGAETTNDVQPCDRPKISVAIELIEDQIDTYLARLKPDFLFYDSTEWAPQLARKHGAKPVYYTGIYVTVYAYCSLHARGLPPSHKLTEGDLIEPHPGFPASGIRLHPHEARAMASVFASDFGNGMTFLEKINTVIELSDAIAFRTCREMEGPYSEFYEKQLGKPVLQAGFLVPETPNSKLDSYFENWLNGFGPNSVIYCAFGSECFLDFDQFQELVLGLELTGRPFLAALKPPKGYKTIEAALPENFAARTKGKGIVTGDWVQQTLILNHASVGCFVSHCGAASLTEGLKAECPFVGMPQGVDQYLNAKLMSIEMQVAVEVDTGDGNIDRYAICKAIELVMDDESEVGCNLRVNCAKWKDILFKEGLEESYMGEFIHNLIKLL